MVFCSSQISVNNNKKIFVTENVQKKFPTTISINKEKRVTSKRYLEMVNSSPIIQMALRLSVFYISISSYKEEMK